MPPYARTILLTGANAGIGFACARQLAAAGHRVLLGCRDPDRGAAAADAIRAAVSGADLAVVPIDLSLMSSVRVGAAVVAAAPVDVVIHNAAAFDITQKERRVTAEGHETVWATNVLGPVLLTELLLPRLRESRDARVLAVTSKGLVMHPRLQVDLDDPGFARRPFTVARAYYHSKLAHLAWMLDLAERLRATDVHVHGVRVTNVKVDVTRYPGLSATMRGLYRLKSAFSISPEKMAETYAWLALDDAGASSTGGYWDGIDRPATVSPWAAVRSNQQALVALARTTLGLP